MRDMPKYKSPVSLIPGGCMQFLDFSLDVSRIERMRRAFAEDIRGDAGAGRHSHSLRSLRLKDDTYVDELTGQQRADDYQLDARKCLERWQEQWIPIPFLRIRDQHWPDDGGDRFECGPSNWSRVRISREGEQAVRVVIAFDMTTELLSSDEPGAAQGDSKEQYAALSDKDVAAHATFRLACRVRDNAWFLNAGWVDEWLYTTWEKTRKAKRGGNAEEDGFQLEYLASYLTLLDVIREAIGDITVQVINPERDTPVDVDLILDIGNARTTGILVETLPQRMTNLNDSYPLQLRDMSQPGHITTEPFETRVEFSEVTFGNDSLSRRSGRRTPAFVWPSGVRVGPEAVRLATYAVCAEGSTGLSSPKRYLWDERPWQQSWRINTGGGPEPMATRGPLARRINSEGTPLSCFDDPLFRRNPVLRRQEREVAFEAHYTRSSLMLFMMVEILLQALLTINSPGQRCRRELPNVPRRLRRVIFTVPSGMPVAEQRIYRRWVLWATRTLWDALGWQDYYCTPDTHRSPVRSDYRLSPVVRCDWDEATCTQLVWLYNELTRKFQGDAHHLFHLVGAKREGYGVRPSVRMATIDIGGGTTDLSITTFELESEESAAARIRPHPEFRDGFNVAGDDILREIVNRHVLQAIGEAAVRQGVRDGRALLAQLFGRNVMDTSQENRNRRARFARQFAVPVALSLLERYEQTDLLSGGGTSTMKFGDFFRTTTQNIIPDEEAHRLHPHPNEAVLRYVEEEIQRQAPDFRLMDAEIRIDPRQLDRTIRETLAAPLANLCEVIQLYDCDMVLLTGCPSRWSGIISSIFAKLPVPPDRIMPMCRFRVGNWYPFSDALGNITDPKTTVVVGAILCALAEGHLEGFSFDTSMLRLKSTARYIGEMDINGQIKQAKVWFDVDVESRKEQELTREVMLGGPISVGFRQIGVERWTTTRFYMVDFATEEARQKALGHLPFKVSMRLMVAAPDDTTERDEGELFIDDVQDRDGNAVASRDLEVRLQTLPRDEGYWLDTGVVYQAV